jgi:hypothetical protein
MLRPDQHDDAKDNSINREGREAALADPSHEPGNNPQRNDERDDETDQQKDPSMPAHVGGRKCQVRGGRGFSGVKRFK